MIIITNLKSVEIYTDGACSGNPGPGGWCCILSYNNNTKKLCDGDAHTTNNRMELTAVISGLKALKEKCNVTIYSDSKYIIDAVEKGYAKKWRENNWTRGKNAPALNKDLWEELLNQIDFHIVKFVWVKGHNGHKENEICDKIAVEMSQKYSKK